MANNEKRNELQTEAVDTLLEKKRLLVEWGTGTGKSRVAVNAIEKLYARGCRRFLLLVAEISHKENWRNELIEAKGPVFGDLLYKLLTVECYASLNKYQNTEWDCIIADEAHHLRSDKRTDFVSTMKSEYVLCLSATLSENRDGEILVQTLEQTFGKFAGTTVTLQDSIDMGIIAEPEIYVHVLPLREGVRDQEVKIAWGFPKARVKIRTDFDGMERYTKNADRYKNVELTVACNPKEGYSILTQAIEDAKKAYNKAYGDAAAFGRLHQPDVERKLDFLHNAWMLAGSRRKSFLGKCKTAFVKNLLKNEVGDSRFICFCADVEQGKELGGDRIICAQRRDNAAVIASYNNYESNALFAVGMAQEGLNLAGIEVGIICQVGGKMRAFTQKMGRALRSKRPIQHIVVINNTHDVDYLRTSLEGINRKYIHYRRYGESDC